MQIGQHWPSTRMGSLQAGSGHSMVSQRGMIFCSTEVTGDADARDKKESISEENANTTKLLGFILWLA